MPFNIPGRATPRPRFISSGAAVTPVGGGSGTGGGYVDPLSTDGDMVIQIAGATARLPVGSVGDALEVVAGIPTWVTPTVETLQTVYDAATAVPQLTIAAGAPLTIDLASGVGDIFAVRDASSLDILRAVGDGSLSMGHGSRRLLKFSQPDVTGKMAIELWPDDFTITTDTGPSASAFFSSSGRTITTNIPGGGGLGNDQAVGGINFQHTMRFEDTGFLFAAQLLINAAVAVEVATNTVGPLYLFLDQYKTYADGGSRTCTQHNAIRAQPKWGPNINGGSITQTSVELFYGSLSVDATVGSASITTASIFAVKAVTLTAGGTIGTFNGIDIANISGPTTIRGINSAMNNGTFINHTGTAGSIFGGDVVVNGRLDINRGIALGAGAAATLGTIGGSGPTVAAQAQWVEIDINGVAHWIPVWT